ncbi:RCF2 [Candida jiufengensis]|uniref:RCF2 n=1 Tax=Candida jiufengensis TaxID=497108 RepID=UPI0022252192|nr:RCF2 [Candida jiufengensis]KAI5950898.1 RCF2 [Candida jiufengensis]
MKIITEEEKVNHRNHIIKEGLKGLAIGGAVSAGIFSFFKYRRPARFATFSPSIKAAIFAMPTIAFGAFFADQGSWEYDKMMHQAEYHQSITQKQELQLGQLTTKERILHNLNEHKYKLVIGGWLTTLGVVWKFIDRDPHMTKTQKAVQVRVVAHFVTLLLLIGTILLNMRDAEIKKKLAPEVPHWKRVLEEQGETK